MQLLDLSKLVCYLLFNNIDKITRTQFPGPKTPAFSENRESSTIELVFGASFFVLSQLCPCLCEYEELNEKDRSKLGSSSDREPGTQHSQVH